MIKRYAVSLYEQAGESSFIVDQDEEWVIVSEVPGHIDDYEPLIEIEKPAVTAIFTDYGFVSSSGHFYLFEPLVTAFSITDGDPIEIEMFLLQLEEYIIAREKTEPMTYWIGKQHEELLTKVASAYHVAIDIFDLDKCGKND
ncbi:hypothetical protein [Anoxybacteroides tepidamans]|uniref:hypothetical protein n=1 Tax=Anoxybacteroides tepidamans TaxID=265948 RepID=UPI0004890EDA|nr:hypothetical protein [Anoxybacillus tepidamans]